MVIGVGKVGVWGGIGVGGGGGRRDGEGEGMRRCGGVEVGWGWAKEGAG